jgi:hypothetical protein
VSALSRYTTSLADLEAGTRVDPEDMVEEQPASAPHVYVAPAELDRTRLLSPTGDGRLTPGDGL